MYKWIIITEALIGKGKIYLNRRCEDGASARLQWVTLKYTKGTVFAAWINNLKIFILFFQGFSSKAFCRGSPTNFLSSFYFLFALLKAVRVHLQKC